MEQGQEHADGSFGAARQRFQESPDWASQWRNREHILSHPALAF